MDVAPGSVGFQCIPCSFGYFLKCTMLELCMFNALDQFGEVGFRARVLVSGGGRVLQ